MTLMIKHISVKAQAREGLGYRYDRSFFVTPALPRQETTGRRFPHQEWSSGDDDEHRPLPKWEHLKRLDVSVGPFSKIVAKAV